MFDFSQLRSFVAVAEEQHFGRAAARLNITQAPLSRQIQVLERVLDVQLVDRTTRSVRLTEAGRSFLPEARRILRLADDAAHIARQVGAGRAGSLRLGFTAASAHEMLPRLISEFRTRFPDAILTVREMVTRDQVEALESGQIDVGLMRPPVRHSELTWCSAVSEPLVVAVPGEHPFAAQSSIHIGDLQGEQIIGYTPNDARYFHNLVASTFFDAGVDPDISQELTQIHSILALVRAGIGLALVPASAQRLGIPGVAFRPMAGARQRMAETILVWRPKHTNALIDELVKTSKAIVSSSAALGR